jgi:hypothetical protein
MHFKSSRISGTYPFKAWLKAASRIDLKSEDGVDAWARVDEVMALATISFAFLCWEASLRTA